MRQSTLSRRRRDRGRRGSRPNSRGKPHGRSPAERDPARNSCLRADGVSFARHTADTQRDSTARKVRASQRPECENGARHCGLESSSGRQNGSVHSANHLANDAEAENGLNLSRCC